MRENISESFPEGITDCSCRYFSVKSSYLCLRWGELTLHGQLYDASVFAEGVDGVTREEA